MKVGIVGLPNVGKSTTFNALTKTQNANAQNFPFCTIEPNSAIVPVPDKRLDELAKIVNPNKIQYSTIEFVDIAGLVKGASKGEGLGNQFLANIRETSLILHMVRCFDDDNVIHVENSVDPIRDIEIIEQELLYADIQQLEKRMEKLQRQAKGSKDAQKELEVAKELYEFLLEGEPVSSFQNDSEEFARLKREMNFLTDKEIMYGANVDEDGLAEDNEYVKKLKEYAKAKNREVVKLCAKLEEEMIDMSDEEKKEFLADMGADESGLEQIIKKSFHKLNLINYFTAGKVEVRSWTIQKGWNAPKAAGVIHGDFEKGFIKAEVISYDDFIKYGGEQGAKEAGKLRLEGKDYIVQDGDVMHFRFNV
ncbi:MAG: redox-regulated ATPase YchF [Epsilonproteobacteria bacterium]|nr:redox-regulated ATPase YchF [Campylobacterota bacterium]